MYIHQSESKVKLLIVSDLDISAKDVELGDKSIEQKICLTRRIGFRYATDGRDGWELV